MWQRRQVSSSRENMNIETADHPCTRTRLSYLGHIQSPRGYKERVIRSRGGKGKEAGVLLCLRWAAKMKEGVTDT